MLFCKRALQKIQLENSLKRFNELFSNIFIFWFWSEFFPFLFSTGISNFFPLCRKWSGFLLLQLYLLSILLVKADNLCTSSPAGAISTGKIRRAWDGHTLQKYGNTLSLKVCLKVWRCVLVRGLKNDTCPPSQSSWTLMRWTFCFTASGVRISPEMPCPYVPLWKPRRHRPELGRVSRVWMADSEITPKTQVVLSPTSTSQ